MRKEPLVLEECEAMSARKHGIELAMFARGREGVTLDPACVGRNSPPINRRCKSQWEPRAVAASHVNVLSVLQSEAEEDMRRIFEVGREKGTVWSMAYLISWAGGRMVVQSKHRNGLQGLDGMQEAFVSVPFIGGDRPVRSGIAIFGPRKTALNYAGNKGSFVATASSF